MRNTATIILLTGFLAFQYARQVSYWECRAANYFRELNEKCDCESLLDTKPAATGSSAAPFMHTHLHLDELFFPSSPIHHEKMIGNRKLMFSVSPDSPVLSNEKDRLLRPPQVC